MGDLWIIGSHFGRGIGRLSVPKGWQRLVISAVISVCIACLLLYGVRVRVCVWVGGCGCGWWWWWYSQRLLSLNQWRNQVGAEGAERPPGQQFWGNF